MDVGSIISMNAAVVALTGEAHVVADLGLLESAAAKPINLWHYDGADDPTILASSLLFGVARNHPFQQGNKRTGWAAFGMFLGLNGLHYRGPDDDATAQAIVDVITGAQDEAWFCGQVSPYVLGDD